MKTQSIRAIRPVTLCLFVAAFLLLSGCGFAAAEPTPTPVPPTNTPTAEPTHTATSTPTSTSTNTPEPTATNTPTNTPEPTETPTNTPEPTSTSTPTEEPTETPTEIPPTNTPAPPTNTPAPADTNNESDAGDSAAAEEGAGEGEEERPEDITLFYISNPNDVLGTFPVRDFDSGAMRNNMNNIRNSLETMRNSLGDLKNGGSCGTYMQAYNNILYSGVFYDPVPPEWQDLDRAYMVSFIYSLDRTRPAFLSCRDANKVDDFNLGLARQTIEETYNFFSPYVDAANSR